MFRPKPLLSAPSNPPQPTHQIVTASVCRFLAIFEIIFSLTPPQRHPSLWSTLEGFRQRISQ